MVSIIIPYYNRPEKLRRAIDSIYKQAYQNFEIILVDDHSTIPLKIDFDSRITVYRNHKNLGPGLSRNVGLENAKGEFITFLDCDDYWHHDFLNTLLPVLKNNPKACMAYSNGVKIDEKEKVTGLRRKNTLYPTSILPNILYAGRRWGTGSCVWRRSYIGEVQFLKFRNWEDYVFDITVGLQNNIVIPVKENLVFYDVSGDDKLSTKSNNGSIIEKHKSIIAISKLLFQHGFENNEKVNKSISILIIKNTIKLLRFESDNKMYILENLKNVKAFRGLKFYFYMLCLIKLPKKTCIKYLKKLEYSLKFDT